jgi:hypothetical protein
MVGELWGTVSCWPRRDLGGPLSAKLFKILVDAVVRKWLCQLRDGGIVNPEEVDLLMVDSLPSSMLMTHTLLPGTPTSYR